ncbi:MAG: bi-domain-containing oxidoreductase [Dehalococcoidia bacterium]|nr:bi-domain-containing oxidoreductase [Dehalococcoidia bacterium]
MRQVCVNERREIVVVEVPDPTVPPGYALVRNAYSLISSGTELGITQQQSSVLRQRVGLVRKFTSSVQRDGLSATMARVRKRFQQPNATLRARGYSSAGVVIQLGEGIEDLRVGDMVACGGGSANHAEVVAVPRNLIARVPPEVSLRDASFTTLGAIAMQGVRRAQVTFGEKVVVTGMGLVGQLVSQLLKVAGCQVIAVDLLEERLRLARELGATHTINAGQEDPVAAAYRIAGDHGVDAVILCAATSSDVPVNQAFAMCRERGRVVIVGDVGMGLERTHFYNKELDLLMSRSYGPGRYDTEYEELGLDYPIGYVRWTENRNMEEFLRLLSSGEVKVEPLVAGEYAIEDAPRAYADLAQNQRAVVATVFKYDSPTPDAKATPILRLRATAETKKSGALRVAVIGAGSFATGNHLPNLRSFGDCQLVAVANSTGVKARQIAQEFKADYCTTDYREILADPNVDAVVIATRHNLHHQITIEAAAKGKHVFVEKPMALTEAEAQGVCQAVTEAGVLLSVGFNRRFAPLVVKLKGLLDEHPFPKTITYRVNAGWLPPDHWLLDPAVGGGRIIGEGCHFFDLLYFLVGAEPVRITATQMRPLAGDRKDDANMSINLQFADGSLGHILYTVVGQADLSKERIEVFTGGRAFVLDDFTSLSAYGIKGLPASWSDPGDKGVSTLLRHFCDAALGKGELQVTAKDGLRATVCAVRALESARTGATIGLA